MKLNFTKVFVAAMAMLFCCGTEVNAQKTKCLREINTQLEGDETYYGYNKDGSLDSIYQYLGYYDEESYRLYKYDDRGNQIAEEGYCILPDDNTNTFTKVFEVLYEFNDKNQRVIRKNYNMDTWSGTNEFVLGGVYTFEYNEKGLLTKRNLYWDEKMTDLYETTDFTYDDGGKLLKETYTSFSFGNKNIEMEIEYTYDENGRNTVMTTKSLDYNKGTLEVASERFYVYDEKGNLLTRTTWDALSKTIPSEQHILLYYEDTLSNDVNFPINYEDEMDFFVKSNSVAMQDTIYKRDADGELFCLFDIQDWKYDDMDTSAGIESVSYDKPVINFFKDVDGNMIIDGLDKSEMVRIYDANGKMMRNCSYNGKVNISSLPNGLYILSTRKGSIKFSR